MYSYQGIKVIWLFFMVGLVNNSLLLVFLFWRAAWPLSGPSPYNSTTYIFFRNKIPHTWIIPSSKYWQTPSQSAKYWRLIWIGLGNDCEYYRANVFGVCVSSWLNVHCDCLLLVLPYLPLYFVIKQLYLFQTWALFTPAFINPPGGLDIHFSQFSGLVWASSVSLIRPLPSCRIQLEDRLKAFHPDSCLSCALIAL